MMGRYLDALRNLKIPQSTNQKNLINPIAAGSLGSLGTRSIGICITTVIESRWWLVKFIDRDPKEICCHPIATAEQVLNAITGAISAEPIASGSRGLTEPDKYGHWSETEVELVTVRTASFVSRGVPMNDADALACHLVERDRTLDDRRSCAECFQLARGRCRLGLQPFGGGGVEVLHRCFEFKEP
jgi:hypothetical protein